MFIPKVRKIYSVPNSSCNIHILNMTEVSETQAKLYIQWVARNGQAINMSTDVVEFKNIQHWQEIGDENDLLSR